MQRVRGGGEGGRESGRKEVKIEGDTESEGRRGRQRMR